MSDPLSSECGIRMLACCPWYYDTSHIFKWFLQASGAELELMKQGVEEVLNQFFVSSTTWDIDKWEEELGILSVDGKPLEQRRAVILAKLRGIGTATVAMIQNVAESYTYGQVSVTEHPETYSFTFKFIDPYGVPSNLVDVQAAIEEIKPAHLGVIYEFSYMTWDEHDVYNKTWNQWDELDLNWDEREVYKEAI